MKTSTLALLLVSHGGLVLLGGWLAGGLQKEPAPAASLPAPVVPKTPAPSTGEASANPIFRATGADFRAAWDELLAGPRGGSENLFVDWCAVDPEGAIQGLGRLPASEAVESYLRAALMYHAADMAPALAKHWRKLQRMPEYKLQFDLGWSVNEFAKKDPGTAAALLGNLPPGMRRGAYDRAFSRLDSASVEGLLKSLPPLPADAIEEKTELWKKVAGAVDNASAPHVLWEWMARADDPVARRALATEGMNKARLAEDWSGFFDAVERMDATAQIEIRVLVRQTTSSSGYRPETLSAISAECQRHGLEDWIEKPASE